MHRYLVAGFSMAQDDLARRSISVVISNAHNFGIL